MIVNQGEFVNGFSESDVYTECYSQYPQLFPQYKYIYPSVETSLFPSNRDLLLLFQETAGNYMHSPPNMHSPLVCKKQEPTAPVFLTLQCFTQNGFGGIGIEAHIRHITRLPFVISLGADHGRIVATKAQGRHVNRCS